MPKADTSVEVTTTQKVNNPDGTQTEITVKERRLKKAHDKQMAKLQSRQRRAESEQLANAGETAAEESDAAESQSPEESQSPAESQAPAESPKADRRRKKSETLAPSPESESAAAEEINPEG